MIAKIEIQNFHHESVQLFINEMSNDKDEISFYYVWHSVSIKQLRMQNLHALHHNNNNRGTWDLSTEQLMWEYFVNKVLNDAYAKLSIGHNAINKTIAKIKRERGRKKIIWKMFATNKIIVCSSGILRIRSCFFLCFLSLISIYGFVSFHLDSW